MTGEKIWTTEEERDIGVPTSHQQESEANCTVHKRSRDCKRKTKPITEKTSIRGTDTSSSDSKSNMFVLSPHLGFEVSAWSPWLKGDNKTLEKVLRKLSKWWQLAGLQSREDEDWCTELGLEK